MSVAAGNISGIKGFAISTGLVPPIDRTFRYAYVLATLKHDEMIGKGHSIEAEAVVKVTHELQDSVRDRA